MRDERERSLSVGDRVRVSGGYDMDPKWLTANATGYEGEVIDFLEGPNPQPAAVVELDEEVVLPDGVASVQQPVRGTFLLLTPAHVGTDWTTPSPRIQVTLSEGRPRRLPWGSEARGVTWVESHATHRILRGSPRLLRVLPPPTDSAQ